MKSTRPWLFGLVYLAALALGPGRYGFHVSLGIVTLAVLANRFFPRFVLSARHLRQFCVGIAAAFLVVVLLFPGRPNLPLDLGSKCLLLLCLAAFPAFRLSPGFAQGVISLATLGLFLMAAGPMASGWALPAIVLAVPVALGSFLAESPRLPPRAALRILGTLALGVLSLAGLIFLLHPFPVRGLRALPGFFSARPPSSARDGGGGENLGLREGPVSVGPGFIASNKRDPTPLILVSIEQGLSHLGTPGRGGAPRLHLRGSTMDEYRGGRWFANARRSDPMGGSGGWLTLSEAPGPASDTHAEVRGKVQFLEGRTTGTYFVVNEPIRVEGSAFQTNRHRDLFVPPGFEPVRAYQFASRVPARATYARVARSPAGPGTAPGPPADLGPALVALRERLFAADDPPFRKAERIREWFRGPDFTYDDEAPPPPAGEDPVGRFLTKTHRGECTHFASAAVLLLRAANVPARLAVGFSSVEFDPGAQAFVVRARDAHAWVEINLRDFGWVAFDPTPPDRRPAVAGTGLAPAIPRIENGPPEGEGREGTMRGWLFSVRNFNGRELLALPWREISGLAAVGALLALWSRIRRARGAAAGKGSRRGKRRAREARVPFFEDFLKLMRKKNLAPRSGETIPAFAARLPDRFPRGPASTLVHLYEAARFGPAPLGPEDLARARLALAELAEFLAPRAPDGAPGP